MTSKLTWTLLQHLHKVWVRVVGFAVLAIATAVLAQFVAPIIPEPWIVRIGADSVDRLLDILASSMLAVTTFSLAIANSTFAAAASTATPRAIALLQQDQTAQNVLATFLGAFVYSLVGLIALKAGYYSETGRVVLFVATSAVVALVVLVLLRWISHLMRFGRMEDTLDRVEVAARQALARRSREPHLGARPQLEPVPASCVALCGPRIGYVLHVDIAALEDVAEAQNLRLWLGALPGSFVSPATPLLHLDRPVRDRQTEERLCAAFSIGSERSFEQDPRFGLIVLSEIASRALSPGVNDPGTAIGVIGRLLRVLAEWTPAPGGSAIRHQRIFVPPVDPGDMIVDAFRPIVRDGADSVEVQIRLHKALHALAQIRPEEFAAPCAALAEDARQRARAQMTETDLSALARALPHPWPKP